jgi:hypothetical protein
VVEVNQRYTEVCLIARWFSYERGITVVVEVFARYWRCVVGGYEAT